MMSALSGYQQGTAGSHLKQYTAACGVLNFAQQYDSNQEEQLCPHTRFAGQKNNLYNGKG